MKVGLWSARDIRPIDVKCLTSTCKTFQHVSRRLKLGVTTQVYLWRYISSCITISREIREHDRASVPKESIDLVRRFRMFSEN